LCVPPTKVPRILAQGMTFHNEFLGAKLQNF
jgi:hypothetical protein